MSISISEIFIFSKNIIYIFDVNSGELVKKFELTKILDNLEDTEKSQIELSKNGKYLIVHVGFLLVIFIKFGSIIKIFKHNGIKIKNTNIIASYLIIFLLNNNSLKSWNSKKEHYQNLTLPFFTKKKIQINNIKKIFIKKFILIFFLSENNASLCTFITFNKLNEKLSNPFLINLFGYIKSFETLIFDNSLIIIYKIQNKIIPVKISIHNFIVYLGLEKKIILNHFLYSNINYDSCNNLLINYKEFLKIKKKIFKNIFKDKNKHIIQIIDIGYKLNQTNLRYVINSKEIMKNLTIFITKYKDSSLFFKQISCIYSDDLIKSLKYLNKDLIEPLLFFVLKKFFQERLNKHFYLLWIKEIIFYHFSYLSQNFYIKYYINKLFIQLTLTQYQEIFEIILMNISILKIQHEKFFKFSFFYKHTNNLLNYHQTILE